MLTDRTRRVRERHKINVEIYVIHTARTRQRASALPMDKIEVSSISDADRAESPASPISSLVIPTWLIERRTVVVVIL